MKALALALVLLAGTSAPAAQADDAQRLLQGCRELVGIYAKREQMRLAAGLTTSLSEALRAGYCQGVVEQFRRQRDEACATPDGFAQAQRIASEPLDNDTSVSELLERSCAA